MAESANTPLSQHQSHSRHWRDNLYVYPVISRRSRGLSIGINLNPDAACNFDCVYCQVDRSATPRVREVDPTVLRAELAAMIALAQDGSLYEDPPFRDVPSAFRRINDLAFSGDGEPTTCKQFTECVTIAAKLRREANLTDTKIVLITDGAYLTRPAVEAGLAIMDQNNGEIWAKLDAGSEAYYRRVNRPNVTLQQVVDNIKAAARIRPLVIQSLFMRLRGEGPTESELLRFTDRLNEITQAGGQIAYVQVYTVARKPAEDFVTALTDAEVDHIVGAVETRTGLRSEAFYGVSA